MVKKIVRHIRYPRTERGRRMKKKAEDKERAAKEMEKKRKKLRKKRKKGELIY